MHTPALSPLGATDELLERLVPVVRQGVATAEPWPFDDPMSLYEDSPDREWSWRRGEPAQLSRWLMTRQEWSKRRRDDITLAGVAACLPALGIHPAAAPTRMNPDPAGQPAADRERFGGRRQQALVQTA